MNKGKFLFSFIIVVLFTIIDALVASALGIKITPSFQFFVWLSINDILFAFSTIICISIYSTKDK